MCCSCSSVFIQISFSLFSSLKSDTLFFIISVVMILEMSSIGKKLDALRKHRKRNSLSQRASRGRSSDLKKIGLWVGGGDYVTVCISFLALHYTIIQETC
eukprot:UN25874